MAPENDQLNPSDYLRVLRRQKLTIAVIPLIAVAVALVISLLQSSVYEATAEVLVRQPATNALFSGGASQPVDPARTLETEIRVINGPDVRAAVRDKLGGTAPKASASAVEDADVIRITLKSGEPEAAVRAADAYANAYVEQRRQQAVEEVLAASREIQARISDLQSQIDGSSGVDREALVQAQAVFRQKLGEAQVGGALNTGGARIVTPASEPTSPSSPRPLRTSIWALSFGVVLGLGVAFLRDHLDDSVKSKEDLERATAGLAAVGLIPVAPGWKDSDAPRLLCLSDPQSATAEAFRTLRTAVQFLRFDMPVRTVQITSPSTREGKTTTAANLGVAMAQSGARVALVCCDLRRPRLSTFFGLSNDVGLTSVMVKGVPMSSALQPVPDQARLFVLPSGALPPNPAELLASTRAADVLESLLHFADVVILDCPPVLPVTDALVLSPRADASLLVCRSGVTTRKEMTRAVELLRQVDAPLAGTILNGVPEDDSYGGLYEYYHSFEKHANGSPIERRTRPRRPRTGEESSGRRREPDESRRPPVWPR